jgi:hypothetical protein
MDFIDMDVGSMGLKRETSDFYGQTSVTQSQQRRCHLKATADVEKKKAGT